MRAGSALGAAGRMRFARKYLERCLELDPSAVSAYLDLGLTYLGVGEPANAIPSFRSATERAPQSGAAFYLLGRALLEAGQPAAAIQPLERAEQLMPGNADVRGTLLRAKGGQ